MTEPITVETAEGPRECLVHLPPGIAGPIPLVLMFHGAGGSAALARDNTGWTRVADEAGFAVAFPEGTRPDPTKPPMFRQNPQTWNDGSGREHVPRDETADIAFVVTLLDDLAARLPLDPTRIFATGFSNGGSLAFRLGAELAHRIAAIAPVAGHLWLAEPHPSRPVPLLSLFGTADPLNPLEGGEIRTPWGHTEYHPPVRQSIERWARAHGGDGTPAPEPVRDADGVRCERYAVPAATGVASAAELLFCTVEGLGHNWPGAPRQLPRSIVGPTSDRPHGAKAIWEFFARQPSR